MGADNGQHLILNRRECSISRFERPACVGIDATRAIENLQIQSESFSRELDSQRHGARRTVIRQNIAVPGF